MASRTFEQWMAEYQKTHMNPTNKKIHLVCVPLIMLSTLGVIRSIPIPWDLSWARWDIVFLVFCMLFYFSLHRVVGVFMILLAALFVGVNILIEQTGVLLQVSVLVFVAAWIGQFIGHKIEGKKPSFIDDLAFLLIGPLWVFRPWYARLLQRIQ